MSQNQEPLSEVEQVTDQLPAMKGLEAVPALLISASREKHHSEIDQRRLIGLAKLFALDDLFRQLNSYYPSPTTGENGPFSSCLSSDVSLFSTCGLVDRDSLLPSPGN